MAKENKDQVEETTQAPAEYTGDQPQVVGAITPEMVPDLGPLVMVCMECGHVHKPGKGVAWCGACGGKTREGYAGQANTIKAEDDARFVAPNPAPKDDE